MAHPPLARVMLNTRLTSEMAAFYGRHFGYTAYAVPGDAMVELRPPGAGVILSLHPLSKGRKEGQSLVKLCFEVADVAAFCAQSAKEGLDFGKLFTMEGYAFANAKDPAGNAIQITSRGAAALDFVPWQAPSTSA